MKNNNRRNPTISVIGDSDNKGLPKDWKWVKLDEVVQVNPKLPIDDLRDNLEVSFLPMRLVEEEKNIIHLTEFRKYGVVKKGFTCFTDGDIIFAKITPCMENGKIAIVHSLKNKIGYGSTEFHVLRCLKGLVNTYLFYFIVQQKYRNVAQHNMTGAVGQRRVPKAFIESSLIPLPPLPEQHRIVAKLEELLSELEKGKEQLHIALDQIKVYRQAVLKYAFEGKLTRQNRGLNGFKDDTEKSESQIKRIEGLTQTKEKNNLRNPVIGEISDSDNGELPNGWKWVKLGEVSDSCLGKMLDKQKNKGKNQPYLRNINVRWGYFDTDDLLEMKFEKDEDERYGIRKGDLIICEGGEPGRAAIWKAEVTDMKIQKALHRVRFNSTVKSEYFYYYLVLIASNKKLEQYFTGTTIKHLTGQSLRKLSFPIASLEEQHRIVEEIESRLSVADKLEETITASLQQSETLRQSILKKAFEGKLV